MCRWRRRRRLRRRRAWRRQSLGNQWSRRAEDLLIKLSRSRGARAVVVVKRYQRRVSMCATNNTIISYNVIMCAAAAAISRGCRGARKKYERKQINVFFDVARALHAGSDREMAAPAVVIARDHLNNNMTWSSFLTLLFEFLLLSPLPLYNTRVF